MLKTILSVSGKPGLYRLLSQGKNNLIVESLQTGQRDRVYTSDIKKLFTWYNILVSANITTFTEEEEPKDN